MPVSIKDIARESGLSVTTISRVLNDRAPHIPPSTRQRVRQVADRMGYRPNAIAQSLRQRSTNIIGFCSGNGGAVDLSDPFMAEVVEGMHKGAVEAGKDFLMQGAVAGRSAEGIYRELLNGKIDGLVLFTSPGAPLVELLSASTLPVVVITDAVPTLPSVVADDAGGSRMLARYLAGKGHTRVLYRKSPLHTESDVRRLAAFCDEAAALGITIVDTIDHFWTYTLSEREKEWLRAPAGERPTAIVAWNDMVAYQALVPCLEMGLRVPEDVAIVGFDGFRSLQKPAYQLTTIRAGWSNVARKAVELLVAQLEGHVIPIETVMPVELVIGDTA
jgi:DNA-binding LacI/PurR family transcriptional regulator